MLQKTIRFMTYKFKTAKFYNLTDKKVCAVVYLIEIKHYEDAY